MKNKGERKDKEKKKEIRLKEENERIKKMATRE